MSYDRVSYGPRDNLLIMNSSNILLLHRTSSPTEVGVERIPVSFFKR